MWMAIEPTTGTGKELPTTRTLCQRAFYEHGAGFVDLVLLDGLFTTYWEKFPGVGYQKGFDDVRLCEYYEYVKWTPDFLSDMLKMDFCIEYQASG